MGEARSQKRGGKVTKTRRPIWYRTSADVWFQKNPSDSQISDGLPKSRGKGGGEKLQLDRHLDRHLDWHLDHWHPHLLSSSSRRRRRGEGRGEGGERRWVQSRLTLESTAPEARSRSREGVAMKEAPRIPRACTVFGTHFVGYRECLWKGEPHQESKW